MSHVNPELDAEGKTHKERVQALFGSSSRILVEAVGRFLRSEPGDLDHHNLRIIAASAPQMKDPQLVADLIHGLPITQMRIAARPIDLDEMRANFEKVLPKLKPRVRHRMIESLVEASTQEVLQFVPPDRLTPSARAAVEKWYIVRLAQGTQQDQARAVSAHLSDRSVVAAVLDSIEEKVERAEQSSARVRRIQLRHVGDGLVQILAGKTRGVTSDDVERAWRIVQRCSVEGQNLDTYAKVLMNLARSRRVNEATAHSVLDAIDNLDLPRERFTRTAAKATRNRLRGLMLAVPETAENAARRAVRSGASLPHHEADSNIVDHRWYLARLTHYRSSDDLLPALSSGELDRLVAKLPLKQLSSLAIRAMADPDALRTIATKSERLSTYHLGALIDNPNAPMDVDLGRFGRWRSPWQRLMYPPMSDGLTGIETLLVRDPRRTDDDLADMIRNERDDKRRTALLGRAPLHRSAGVEVFEVILAEMSSGRDMSSNLEYLAQRTGSSLCQRRLAELSDRLADEGDAALSDELRSRLALNVDLDLEGLPTNWIEDMSFRQQVERTRLIRGDPSGILDLPKDDPLASGAVQAIIDSLSRRMGPIVDAERDAMRLLADNGRLNEEHWGGLTRHPDLHVVMMAVSDPNCPPEASSYAPAAAKLVASTAKVLEAGAVLPSDSKLKAWSDLPDDSDVPFHLPRGLKTLDGRVVDGLTLELITNIRALAAAADYMGNCLAGYEDSAKSGSSAIATARTEDGMLAVSWHVQPATVGVTLNVSEVNSRFNRGEVPREFRRQIDELTRKFNKGELEPPAVQVQENPPVVRRAQPRRRLVLETESRAAAAPLELEAPSILSSSSEVVAHDAPVVQDVEGVPDNTSTTPLRDANDPTIEM